MTLHHGSEPLVGGGGGFYERMVRVVKRPLRNILRRTNVSYGELLTKSKQWLTVDPSVTFIRTTVNSRPLCYLYSDDVDRVLTPSHLLTGKRLISTYCLLPEACYEENATTMSNRLSYLRTLIQHFQKRWKHEYLMELREFQRNYNKLPAKQILINDETLPRNRWKSAI